jgi:osmotically-inducible protein OsmY
LWGVRGVGNLISVQPSATPSELKKQIDSALVRDAQLNAQGITVEIRGAKAILKGSAGS